MGLKIRRGDSWSRWELPLGGAAGVPDGGRDPRSLGVVELNLLPSLKWATEVGVNGVFWDPPSTCLFSITRHLPLSCVLASLSSPPTKCYPHPSLPWSGDRTGCPEVQGMEPMAHHLMKIQIPVRSGAFLSGLTALISISLPTPFPHPQHIQLCPVDTLRD